MVLETRSVVAIVSVPVRWQLDLHGALWAIDLYDSIDRLKHHRLALVVHRQVRVGEIEIVVLHFYTSRRRMIRAVMYCAT